MMNLFTIICNCTCIKVSNYQAMCGKQSAHGHCLDTPVLETQENKLILN